MTPANVNPGTGIVEGGNDSQVVELGLTDGIELVETVKEEPEPVPLATAIEGNDDETARELLGWGELADEAAVWGEEGVGRADIVGGLFTLAIDEARQARGCL